MKNYKQIILFLLTGSFVSFLAKASVPKRISSLYFNKGEVQKLYLYPGRVSLVDFPCPITSFALGPSGDVQATNSEKEPKELDVWLRSGHSEPTNLIVRCKSQVFVFDIIPSGTNHQEYIKIVGSYGAPEFNDENDRKLKVISSSRIHGRELNESPTRFRDEHFVVRNQRSKLPTIKKVLISSKAKSTAAKNSKERADEYFKKE